MSCQNQFESTENPSAALAETGVPAGAAHSAPPSPHSALVSSGWATVLAAGLIVLATVAAFGNSFSGAFVLDDGEAIGRNFTIRKLWPIWQPLNPPHNRVAVGGRPLLNFSLAINYKISGDDIWSYHAANLAIHILAALLLFGILRRMFLLPAMHQRWSNAAVPLAFVIALLWAVHPLQTESVTYVAQRAESLMGLLYLLTLYCFLRAATSLRPAFWYIASVLACLLGMATKEVMVSAPLVVFLYDRTFCAGSFREAWRRRRGLYVAYGCTWLLLAWLVASAGNLGQTTTAKFTWWSYLLTQPAAIVHYLRVSLWPVGLSVDWNWSAARTLSPILLPGILVVGMLLLTAWGLVKQPAWGFLGAGSS